MSIKRTIIKGLASSLERGRSSLFQKGEEVGAGDHRKAELLRKIQKLEQRLGITLSHEQKRKAMKIAGLLNSKGVRLTSSTLFMISAGLVKIMEFGVKLGDDIDQKFEK